MTKRTEGRLKWALSIGVIVAAVAVAFILISTKEEPPRAEKPLEGTLVEVIQINTSLPIYIGSAVGLACHEGYPGHHVNNILWERDLLRGRRRAGFYLYPLFWPQRVITE